MIFDRSTFTFAANGSSPTFGIMGKVGLSIEWGTGVTAGSVTFEHAPTATPLAWKAESPVAFSSAPKIDSVLYEVGSPVGRITVAALTGGTIKVTVVRHTDAVY